MNKKTLRRRCIIRETDFHKVKKKAFEPLLCMGLTDTLYDRAEWIPITKQSHEQSIIIKGLKGEQMPRGGSWLVPSDYLVYARDSLYNPKYIDWNPRYDENEYMVVQPRKNLEPVRLGWGIFEKDITRVKNT